VLPRPQKSAVAKQKGDISMNVFITGATGYIGSSVAEAFRRAGHQVWGLVLNAEQAPRLEQQEILPVIGDLRRPDSYRGIAAKCEALIHCAADYQHDWAGSDRQTIETMVAISQQTLRPKTVVYTSGSWVYGDTGGRPVDEGAPLATRIIAGGHRPATEQMLVKATGVRGLAIRPADVYGKREGFLGRWFAAAYRHQPLMIPGDGHNHVPLVHVDDLGAGYLLAVESGMDSGILNVADSSRLTLRELVAAIAQAVGDQVQIRSVPVSQAAQSMGAEAEIYAMDCLEDASKAAQLLGWKPRHNSFVEDAGIYFEAWKAWHPQDTKSQHESKRAPASSSAPSVSA
jgi:nucleoside-diphosphate-sugar epimerase